MASKQLTSRKLETIKPDSVRREVPDGLVPALYHIVQPSGARSWCVRFRVNGASRKLTLGPWPALPLAKARELARDAILAVKAGRDPIEERKAERRHKELARADTLRAVAEAYLKREEKRLRTAKDRRRIFERLIFPRLGVDRPMSEIRRGDVVRLLDHVEDHQGPRMADYTAAILGRLFNWHAIRCETFANPIPRGMEKRRNSAEAARERTLTDDELRRVWAAAEAQGTFGALIQFLLLTGARRNEAARISRAELDAIDWLLPAARHKNKTDLLRPLSGAAMAVLAKLPKFADCDFIFTNNGRRPISAFDDFKRQLDERCGVRDWRLHDLRRTARSLMSRAGIDSDIAERMLGHTMPGVRRTYDRHEYYEEKKLGFEKLATQIGLILDPRDNVAQLRPRRRRG
jgi:integrase